MPTVSRQPVGLMVTAALLAAVLLSSVSVTADAISVFQGASLPQVLLVLIAAIAFALSRSADAQPASNYAADSVSQRRQLIWIGLQSLGWLWLIASTLHASWYANGRAAWNGFWHLTALACFAWMMRRLCLWPSVERTLLRFLIASAIILSAHGLHQHFVSLPAARAQYEANPEQVLMQLQLDAPPGSATRRQYENRLYSSEPVASFALANSLAVVLTGTLTAIWLLLVPELLKAVRPTRVVVSLALVSGIITWAWLLTKSRSAYAALVLVLLGSLLAVAAVYYRRRRLKVATELTTEPPSKLACAAGFKLGTIGLALAGGLFAALLWTLASDRLILSEAPKSLLYRLQYWQATARMILSYGWTGVGLGNFQSYYPQFKLPEASEIIADPHNICLDVAATCSVPVLIIAVMTGLSILTSGFMRWLQPPIEPSDVAGQTGDNSPTVEQHIVRALWLGGLCGLLGSITLQVLLRESVDVEASLLGATLAAVSLPFIACAGDHSPARLRAVALAAVTAMLICLLTTGSWQASGIAFPLLAWLAMAAPATQPPVMRNHRALIALRGGLILLLIAFVLQTWRPVNTSWAAAQSAAAAMDAADWDAAESLAQSSLAADRLDPTPHRLLVQIRVARAGAEPTITFSQAARSVQQAIDQLLACDDAGPGNWSFACEQLLTLAELAEKTQDTLKQTQPVGTLGAEALAYVQQAADYGHQAILRYPSSVALHVQQGTVLALLGRREEAKNELEYAVSLSERTPHLDRQLGSQQIWLPKGLAKFPAHVVIRPRADSSWAQAEPLCDYLRSNW